MERRARAQGAKISKPKREDTRPEGYPFDRQMPYRRIRQDTLQEYIVDLNDPRHYEHVREVVDSLGSTGENLVFRVLMTPWDALILKQSGIPFRKTKIKSRSLLVPPSELSPKIEENKEEDRHDETDKAGLIFYESFEAGLSGVIWEAGDQCGGGEPYWDVEGCETYSGDSSVWCTGSLWYDECPYYAWDQCAYLDMIQGVDISNYDNVQISYAIWSEVHSDDETWVYWHGDGGEFWDSLDAFGSTSGWWNRTYNVPAEWDSVYISFYFDSYTGSTTEKGTFVDYIRVTGTLQPQPNLTYGTPPGWSGPIVPSSVFGTNTTDSLFIGVPTYIDFAVFNTGAAELWGQSMRTVLYLDNQYLDEGTTNWIPAGGRHEFLDRTHTIYAEGDHVLKIVIDADSVVSESYEGDNVFVDTFTWIQAPPAPQPNLTFGRPVGWEGPVILSDKNCTGNNGTIFHNQESYINVGVTNTGSATAQSFVVRIEVQGSLVAYTSVDSLPPGETFEWCGPSHEFDLGINSVEIWADFFGEVQESNEGDNYYLTNVQCDSAELSVEGELRYYELVSGMQYVTVAQSYWVEMFGKDYDGSEQLLASGFAVDEVFSIGPVPNYNSAGNRWNVFLKIYAVNPAARLLELTKHSLIGIPAEGGATATKLDSSQLVFISSDTTEESRSGTICYFENIFDPNCYSIIADPAKSPFFFIADVVSSGREKWLTIRPSDDPGWVWVLLSDGIGTSYNHSQRMIEIDSDTTGFNPDTYDRDAITHEYGHRLASSSNFFDAGPSGSHWLTDRVTPEFAAKEGFPHFWACYCSGNNTRYRSYNLFADTLWINLEDGRFGYSGAGDSSVQGSVNCYDTANEGTVAGLLWDIYDASQDNYSGRQDWGDTALPHHPDTVTEGTNVPIETILSACMRTLPSGHRPDNMREFLEAWFTPPSLGWSTGMRSTWYEHGDSTFSCCTGIRGNVNGDPNDEINVADLTYIADYLFGGGPQPPCYDEGNLDGSFGLDISDLGYLVDYLYRGGPPPPSCP